MKFENMKYERPNIQEIEKTFKEMIDEFKNSKSAKEQLEIINKLNDYSRDFSTMFSLANIRYSINTNDEFYKKEIEFINENEPILDGLENEFKKLVFNSKFKEELKEKLGEHYFNLIELKLKTFKPEIIEDLKEENKLKMQYTQLISSGKVEFQGKERTLSQLTPFEKSEDREVRKNASKAKYDWLASKVDQLDEIYDNLVKVRDRIAKKLGYENFVQLGYDRMRRTDYDHKMVKNYRDQVKEVLVPLTQKLYKEQKERVGIDDFKFYDEPYAFKGGNPDPVGTSDELVENARKMYEELSVETGEFFNFMIDNHLLDLESKEGKRPGGFCTILPKYKSPFIFSNFNGTAGDVKVLTHEAGHGFQMYSSLDKEIPDYWIPTMESAEIHSMSMEFFTWPWWNLFYKNQAEKARYIHMLDSLKFIPYGVAVDEFQHFVYENPTVTPEERRKKWKELENKYLPHRDYDGHEYLENGGFWQRQTHIYATPFYYIDYTLAQVCALQFWKKDQDNHEKAWKDYVNLCKAGGEYPFTKLIEIANLELPFKDGTLKSVIGKIENYINSVDQNSL